MSNENKNGRPCKAKSPFTDIFRFLIMGETQQEVANRVGVSRQNVGKWLAGETTPDINTLVKIADAYGVSTDYLLGRTLNKTTDINKRAACDITGLSEAAIDSLAEMRTEKNGEQLSKIVSDFMSHPLFGTMANQISYTINLLNNAPDNVELSALARIMGVLPNSCNTVTLAAKLSAENAYGILRCVIDDVVSNCAGKHLLIDTQDLIVIKDRQYLSNLNKGGDSNGSNNPPKE